jgi:hypothetical protein
LNPAWKLVGVLLSAAALLGACASRQTGTVSAPDLPDAREYLSRGMSEVDAADAVRRERSPNPSMGGVFGWPPDAETWSRHLLQAQADFQAILGRFPGSPEAADAQFMLGRINDHPYRNRFDDALAEYRKTVERYPGTPAAEKASQRIGIIEAINN